MANNPFCVIGARANHMVVEPSAEKNIGARPHARIARYSRKTQSAGRPARRSTVQDLTYIDCGGAAGRFGRPWIAACLTITIRSIFRGPGLGRGQGRELAGSLGLAPPVQS